MVNKKNNNDIDSKLKDIFMNRFNINLCNTDVEELDANLLGKEFNLQPRDLLYLYCDIENIFGITIPQQEVAVGKFNTYNNIYEIIYNQLIKDMA